MRMTPCESWPHRLASTRLRETTPASSAGTPPASKSERTKERRSSAVTIGTVGPSEQVTSRKFAGFHHTGLGRPWGEKIHVLSGADGKTRHDHRARRHRL